MDYHIGWIFSCFCLTYDCNSKNNLFKNEGEVITGTQEDVDFLVVYQY